MPPFPRSEEEIESALSVLTTATGLDRSALIRNMILRELQFSIPQIESITQKISPNVLPCHPSNLV